MWRRRGARDARDRTSHGPRSASSGPPREGGRPGGARGAAAPQDRQAAPATAPRRRAPATQHRTAHRGHRPQRTVRVGRVRGRACAASRRGLLRTPLSTHPENALPLSASTWPTQPSRSRGHTPQSRARMRPRGLEAREHTACGLRPSATPPPAGETERARVGRGPTARACEDEGEGEAKADVSVKEGSGCTVRLRVERGGGERHAAAHRVNLHGTPWASPTRVAGYARARGRAAGAAPGLDARACARSGRARHSPQCQHMTHTSRSAAPATPRSARRGARASTRATHESARRMDRARPRA